MTGFLGITCICGRSARIECPTIADIPTAQEGFVGWGYDDHGFVRCPECLAAGETIVQAPDHSTSRQHEPFGSAA